MPKNLHNQRGAALLLFMLFFLLGSTSLALTFGRSFYSDLLMQRLLTTSTTNFYVTEAGVEDMAYRFVMGLTPDAEEVLTLNGVTATTTYVYDGTNDRFDIRSEGEYVGTNRVSTLSLYTGSGASFNFGVQSGNGGFTLTNGSSVSGNVFSNGRVQKTGGGNAWIYGDVISAGASGRIISVRTTGTARANRIETSYIEGDAHFVTESGNTVLGTRYSGAVDETPADLPITDTEIDAIKQDVVDNGTVIASSDPLCSSGTYTISADTTIGFLKVECNLEVNGNNTDLYLTGPLWVSGNITFKSGPNLHADASVGNRTVPIVADNESDRINSSQIIIENSTSFAGSGSPKSYILLISQNNAAENGNTTPVAITVQQSSFGDLLVYAGHGKILLGNSASLKEVTGYLIELGNNAVITYESGLVNLLFTSGPGGGFTFSDWRETY